MALLVTTISSPIGPIMEFEGRITLDEGKERVARILRKQIADAEAHLAELDNWTHSSRRGNAVALTAEEIAKR